MVQTVQSYVGVSLDLKNAKMRTTKTYKRRQLTYQNRITVQLVARPPQFPRYTLEAKLTSYYVQGSLTRPLPVSSNNPWSPQDILTTQNGHRRYPSQRHLETWAGDQAFWQVGDTRVRLTFDRTCVNLFC